MDHCYDRPDQMVLGRIVDVFGILLWKKNTECSQRFNRLFCGGSDMSVERITVNGDLACKVSETNILLGSLCAISK